MCIYIGAYLHTSQDAAAKTSGKVVFLAEDAAVQGVILIEEDPFRNQNSEGASVHKLNVQDGIAPLHY